MVKKLTQHGNSAALVIDKAILELLHIQMDTPLELSTDGKSLVISPIRDKEQDKRFRAALEAVNRRHAKTLRQLAQ